MPVKPTVYGLLAEFDSPTRLLEAVRCARREGYDRLEAFTPIPVEGLREELGRRRSWLPLIVLLGGVAGAALGYVVQYYTNAIDDPLNVGGRPLNSWPAFLVVTFEVAVLVAALTAVVAMPILSGLPMPYHPVFNVPRFALASRNRFFLCVRATDPHFDANGTRRFLDELRPQGVWEVPR
jgi:hypothetical protein